ncbi:MAG: hypothetical protein HKN12_02190, partial [Gemmatimonadetes bacterium]|nr:hypothetical protein [Gemmatimonadota bacterium]
MLSLVGAPDRAEAAYQNPRLYGDPVWEPDHVRIEESLGRLQPRYRGYLRGPKRVREEIDIDLEAGVVVIRSTYGNVPVAPEWIEDLTTASKAAARRASRDEWVDQVKR